MFKELKEEIKKPYNTLMIFISLVTFFVSIIFSFYFYNLSKREQRPTYIINGEVSKIFDSKNTSPKLILLNENKELIKEDVYLMTVSFWNSGSLSIEPNDIRKNVTFKITNCEKIVDFNIITQTNPDVTNFALSYGNNQKSLILKWDHLDPQNGAKFQLFFISHSMPDYQFTGNILGNTKFINGQPWINKFSNYKWIIFFVVLMLSVIIMGIPELINANKIWLKVLFVLIGGGLLLGFIYFVDKFGSIKPPF